jgi:uncharacterized DUF497 family protein
MLAFQWSQGKSHVNVEKHGISFEEASSVFHDEYALQFFDELHSEDEDRFLMLGMSIKFRILLVVHCVTDGGRVIRIISARKATAKERDHHIGPKP